jgi:hypothetical protein
MFCSWIKRSANPHTSQRKARMEKPKNYGRIQIKYSIYAGKVNDFSELFRQKSRGNRMASKNALNCSDFLCFSQKYSYFLMV